MSMVSAVENPFSIVIKDFFKKEDYVAKTAFAKDQALSYLIVLKQPQELIDSYITKLFQSNSPKINSQTLCHGLPALSIAVIMDEVHLVKSLLNAGADPNRLDNFGWTPVVYSALACEEIADELIKFGGKRDHVTTVGAVTFDWLKEAIGKSESSQGLSHLVLENDDEKIENPSKEVVESFMGINRYRDHSFYHLEHLRNLWDKAEGHERIDPFNEMYIVEALKGNKPRLLLKKDSSINGSMNRGLFACDKIFKGQFVTIYIGESILEKSQDSLLNHLKKIATYRPYVFERIDAQEIGNESRMMNDGLPNLFFLTYGCRTFFFALKDLNPGEELLWNYGITEHRLKFGPYVLKNKEQLHSIVKENIDDWESEFHKAHAITKNTKFSLEKRNKALITVCGAYAYIKYLVDTPSALIDLVVKGTITKTQMCNLFKTSFVMAEAETNEVSHFLRIRVMNFLLNYDHVISGIKNPLLKKQIQEVILEQEGKMEVLSWMKLIRFTMNLISIHSEEEILNSLPKLYPKLVLEAKKYIFTEFDKTCPLEF